MNRTFLILVLSLLLGPAFAFADEPASQWIVVTAPAFRDAVQPLIDHRKEQGFLVTVVPTKDVQAGDAVKLRQHVNKLCREHKGTSSILLVGAVSADKGETIVPPLPGTASRMKGQPSDNGYGCPGEGLQATVAVGRFPARTEAEAKAMVAKTIAFEKDTTPGPWRRRLTVLAGVPAFNPIVDKLVERLAISRFDKMDPSWSGQALYHNPQSPFTVPDAMARDRAVKMVEGGQAFTLYLGHSNAEGFWAGDAPYMTRDDWAKVKIERGPGVLVSFGCYGCQLKGPDGEGYGVVAVRNPNGPVAALGSHEICFAAMVELASSGLFEKAFSNTLPERLGEVFLALKASVAKGKIDPITFKLLDTVDGDSKISQADQRLEHLEMFLLLGDPALRLPQIPSNLKLTLVGDMKAIAPAKEFSVRGEAPDKLEGAKVRVTLERPPSSDADDLERLPKDAKERDKVMLTNHERANRFVLAKAEATVRDGRFEVMLEAPKTLPGRRFVIRAYAVTDQRDGQGVLKLELPRKE